MVLTGQPLLPPAAAQLPTLARWTLLCAVAEGVGMTAAAAAAGVAQGLLESPAAAGAAVLALSLVVAAGLVEGTALGLAQASGLKGVLGRRRCRQWVLVTVAVAGLGWAAFSAPAVLMADAGAAPPPVLLVLLGGAALGPTTGTVLGAAQAAVLRGAVPRPWRWVGASAAGWTPAMLLVFLGAGTPAAHWPLGAVLATAAVTGLLAGAVLGLVSGRLMPAVTRG